VDDGGGDRLVYGRVYPDGFEPAIARCIQKYGVPADRKIGQMSKGTRAKVVLSLAMAHEPALLVLDEPTRDSTRSCGGNFWKAWSISPRRGEPCS
jgi:energy-coupling factor transporter ATP-binding protein EcfA2